MSNPQPTPTSGRAMQLRPLLPSTGKPYCSPVPNIRLLTPRINPVLAACDACRQRKVKVKKYIVLVKGQLVDDAINVAWPATMLPNDLEIYEEVIDLLKSLPDRDAQSVLQRIRAGFDLRLVLSQVKAGDILLQMAVVPETRLRYEFPYRPEMPTECSINSPYLNSLVYEAASVYSNNPPAANAASGLLGTLPSEEQRSLYLKPFHAAQVIEPLLSDAKPSLWTSVCKDDELMRDLLRVLLRCEYQFTGAFHKDLLLEDMASRGSDFCSPLLVNVLLAYTCVCYPQFSNRVKYWDPTSLMYRFIAEAKRLWELEVTVARITTIQAGILFCVFHNLCGLDEIGQTYRLKTMSLANQLRIFDCAIEGQSERLQRGREFTAWAVYNWEALSASTLMQPPLIKKRPRWPLPNPSEDPSWYGEVWVRYPLNHGLSPCYIGEVLRAKSQFRVITNEFCEAAYSKNSKMDVDLAYDFYGKLEHWHDSLRGPLTPKRIVLPGQFHIQGPSMSYYHILLTIFEPLSDAMTAKKPSSQQIVASSKRNLQTLIRLYYLRHGFEATDLFIVIPLMVIAYDATNTIKEGISEEETEKLRSTLILMAYGLYHQRRSHYLAQALFRVIRGKMRPQEIGLLRSSMALEKGEVDPEPEVAVTVRSRWPVSGVVKRHEDVKSHMLSNLVDSLENVDVKENP
ncbi:hypothetical protein FGRMN_1919 [Fusarium graminum]|nr:hypothetical protein FGRMN_1919 [Fusarium graminum]